MKRNKFKIGEQRPKRPFPVVNMRLRPGDTAGACVAPECKSLKFFSERPKAAFLAQVCADMGIVGINGLNEKERGELVWEKAYRDQLAGKEPGSNASPICAQCAEFALSRFLGDGERYEQQAAMFIIASMTTGQDLVLFDRNLSRARTDPAVLVGTFETLADFRSKYWEALEADA